MDWENIRKIKRIRKSVGEEKWDAELSSLSFGCCRVAGLRGVLTRMRDPAHPMHGTPL